MKKIALLIIDMQNDFVLPNAPQPIAGALEIIPNIQKILSHFRENSLPIFHVYREYRVDGSDIEKSRLDDFLTVQKYCVPNTHGCEIIDELAISEGEYRIVKNRFSGFMQTELDFILRRLEIENIVVCGIQYPNCIRATIFDGVALGYDVQLITDATGAKTEEIAQANILDIKNIGVDCIDTQTFMNEKKMKKTEETNSWNATQYNKHASFVSALALPVVALLNPKKGEKILDLGCGEGTLALEIAKYGAELSCVDLSADMVEKSRAKGLNSKVMSATAMPYNEVFDAVFSNATLHWVKERELAVENIYRALKVGGRFVAEFGGEGNVYHIETAMRKVFEAHPEYGDFKGEWFFPSAEEYQNILEIQGFKVSYIELIPRPTPIDDIANWLKVFTNGVTKDLTPQQEEDFRVEVREILKEKIYTPENGWVADYVRIRVEVFK